MVRILTLTVLVTLLTGTACREAPSTPPDRRALEARNLRDFETAWNRDFTRLDVERLVSRYTPDATLLLPNAAPAVGSEAIRNAWKAAVQDSNFSMRLENTHLEVARSADVAWSQGAYTATMTDPVTAKKVRESGSYVILYRKGSGNSWQAVTDTHTPSAPAAEIQ
jgi:ketosteroid isomerase-like protein